jgi:hypothetical protein
MFPLLILDPMTAALFAEPDRLSPLGSERLDGDQVATELGHQLVNVDPCFGAGCHHRECRATR